MKKIFALSYFIMAVYCSNAQSLKKYPISNSGCTVYLFCNPAFDESYSGDSSKVYTAECTKDSVTYGTICVKLLNPVNDINLAEDLVVSYLDFLKKTFTIEHAVGYGRGNRLGSNENTRGVIDYWRDKDNNNWKIKAWTDGRFIGIVYAYTGKELPEARADVVLNSFRFPGM